MIFPPTRTSPRRAAGSVSSLPPLLCGSKGSISGGVPQTWSPGQTTNGPGKPCPRFSVATRRRGRLRVLCIGWHSPPVGRGDPWRAGRATAANTAAIHLQRHSAAGGVPPLPTVDSSPWLPSMFAARTNGILRRLGISPVPPPHVYTGPGCPGVANSFPLGILKGFRERKHGKGRPGCPRENGNRQTTSTGHLGMDCRKAAPYFLVRMRLSSTTMMPWSVFVRMSRPTPWRNLRMASGRE